MNSYFTQSWTAIGNANEILESNVLHLIQEFDPPANLNVFLDDFLTALSTIFAVIKLPEGSVLSDTAAEGLSAVVHETAQLPIIGKYLFPSDGSLGDQIAQFGRIGNEASTIVQQYQENITLALHAINSNCDTFLAIANTTVFSNPPVSVQDLSNKILQILYVFIISQIMIANNIVVAMSPIPQWFTNPIDPITGLSSDWYVDTTSNMTYSMTNLADIRKNYTAVMTEVLTGYTTGPLLFQGAVACNGGRVSISGPQVSCLSSVQVHTSINPSIKPNAPKVK